MNIKSLSPRVTSTATYIYAYDEFGVLCVLGGRRGSTAPTGAGLLNPVMGLVEFGESSIESAVREVYEETGLVLDSVVFEEVGLRSWSGGSNQNYRVVLDVTAYDYYIGDGDGENERFSWHVVDGVDVSDWAFRTGYNVLEFAPR